MPIEIDDKPSLQFILIMCLCLISVILFSIIGGFITFLAYGVDGLDVNNLGNVNTIKGLKILQLFTAGGLFVVAPIVYAMISSKNLIKKLSLVNTSKPINYLLIFGLMVVSIPFLSWVIEFNGNIVLPEFLSGIEQWFKIKQEEALIMQNAFLTFEGAGELIIVIILIVIIPAFGEELLFRGVLQKIFISWTNNYHIGIWITAFLFGLLHMQFYSFLPIMLLGAMFGYIFYWSKIVMATYFRTFY
ncbi:MAG: CPBP family intramembrane metalloprotease [Flavobacteriales bacterium]|nr:CPBP family intramembrane metalloprotease [Flavobacteriales bacterium]